MAARTPIDFRIQSPEGSLSNVSDSSQCSDYGYSALHAAVISRDIDHLDSLLAIGCELELRDSNGFTALHVATLEKSSEVATKLINAGSDQTSLTLEGMSPLHIASEQGESDDLLTVLVSNRSSVNIKNKVGRTALHLAARQGYVYYLKILLDADCEREITDKFGAKAVDVAREYHHVECVEFLLHYQREKESTLERKENSKELVENTKYSAKLYCDRDEKESEKKYCKLSCNTDSFDVEDQATAKYDLLFANEQKKRQSLGWTNKHNKEQEEIQFEDSLNNMTFSLNGERSSDEKEKSDVLGEECHFDARDKISRKHLEDRNRYNGPFAVQEESDPLLLCNFMGISESSEFGIKIEEWKTGKPTIHSMQQSGSNVSLDKQFLVDTNHALLNVTDSLDDWCDLSGDYSSVYRFTNSSYFADSIQENGTLETSDMNQSWKDSSHSMKSSVDKCFSCGNIYIISRIESNSMDVSMKRNSFNSPKEEEAAKPNSSQKERLDIEQFKLLKGDRQCERLDLNRKTSNIPLKHVDVDVTTNLNETPNIIALKFGSSPLQLAVSEHKFEQGLRFILSPYTSLSLTPYVVPKRCLLGLCWTSGYWNSNELLITKAPRREVYSLKILSKLLNDLGPFLYENNLPKSAPGCTDMDVRRFEFLHKRLTSKNQETSWSADDFADILIALSLELKTWPSLTLRLIDATVDLIFFSQLVSPSTIALALLSRTRIFKIQESGSSSKGLYVADLSCFLFALNHVIRRDSTPLAFSSSVLELLLVQPKALRLVVTYRLELVELVIKKVLSSREYSCNEDRVAKMFVDMSIALKGKYTALCKCVDTLLEQSLACEDCNNVLLCTRILIRMGLLKSEDYCNATCDLKGPLMALGHVFEQLYFPRVLAGIFVAFLARQNPRLANDKELHIKALKAAALKEILPTSAKEDPAVVGKGLKRICDVLAHGQYLETAYECFDILLVSAFSVLECKPCALGESLLIYLGLLKSEERLETVRETGDGLKLILHAIRQGSFPETLEAMFVTFLNKPCDKLRSYTREVVDIVNILSETSKDVQT